MPHLPDEIIIKKKKELQGNFYVVATLIGIGGIIALFNGAGGGAIALIISYIVFWLGSKIKTKKTFQGGTGLYK